MATTVKRPTGRDQILDAVLDAAERLFASAGPADVSLRAIAAEAGVNYGLVHRHFGTKDALFDQLMQRYAQRWLAELEDHRDYDAALDRLLGRDFETSPNLRLLAWTLLSTTDVQHGESYRRHAALDGLPTMLEDAGATAHDAAIDTAAALAFAFGWRFFNPYIRAALHLDSSDETSGPALQAAMRAHLHRIASTGVSNQAPDDGEAPGDR
jgi:AcrR family transcriptional regulator